MCSVTSDTECFANDGSSSSCCLMPLNKKPRFLVPRKCVLVFVFLTHRVVRVGKADQSHASAQKDVQESNYVGKKVRKMDKIKQQQRNPTEPLFCIYYLFPIHVTRAAPYNPNIWGSQLVLSQSIHAFYSLIVLLGGIERNSAEGRGCRGGFLCHLVWSMQSHRSLLWSESFSSFTCSLFVCFVWFTLQHMRCFPLEHQ